MIEFNVNEEARNAFRIAQSIAQEYTSANYSGIHLFKSLLHNEIGLSSNLVSNGKDVNYLKDWIDYRLETYPKSPRPISDPPPDKTIHEVYEVADLIRLKFNEPLISPFDLLIALVRPNLVFNDDQLKTLTLSENELLKLRLENTSLGIADSQEANDGSTEEKKIKGALFKYCMDKTQDAHDGKIDEIIGREGELRRLKEIIGRRSKPNVIIVGEPGVGKSSLVDGFALDLIVDNVPQYLSGYLLLELDLGTLIAGASYKGEIEDRLKNIINELKSLEQAILFIDEIHTLLDPQSGFGGAANLLKPELARGAITVIGATTNEEYRKYIESDEAFNRRFDLVRVNEPDFQTSFQMLNKIIPYYEDHHNVKIEKDAIEASISLCQRYVKERRLPDSAIDLIDQTMSAMRMMTDTTDDLITKFQSDLSQLNDNEAVIDDYEWLKRNISETFSPILLGKLSNKEIDLTNSDLSLGIDSIKTFLEEINIQFQQSPETVTIQEIAAIVSQKTGIPLGKLQSDEKEKLLKLESILSKRVVGQNHAINIISEAVRESRAGLIKEGQPIGSFFFMGPTGTGKTELAKSLAEFLFNDEKALLRFDMSEFKEEHSVALLYGAPPGYVGYEEGGLLVNKIRQNPYSVVLFDEIEKAHHSVFDLFLQILDEGKLSDRLGKIGDFSNSIILFTSNIGSKYIIEKFNNDNIPLSTELMEQMSNSFRPEFLARLTEIVPFSPIKDEMLMKIMDIQLTQLLNILNEKEISLNVSEEAKRFIAEEGFDQRYGARPIKGRIRNLIRRPLSKKIISGKLKKGNEVSLSLNTEKELIWNIT